MATPPLLAICGSLRTGSFNRKRTLVSRLTESL